jgi:glycerophosphoryl diester phosphodiesterase
MRYFFSSVFILVFHFCLSQIYTPRFDIQGHRGCRGIKPENSIPAFITALDSGVTTIEMDLAITKDRQVIVSHEPWMSAAFCMTPEGKDIAPKDEMKYNIYQMNYDQVKQWDCGSKVNDKFPEQEKMRTVKPLLTDVIIAVETHIKSFSKYEVDYNIEIKSMPEGDGKFHPKPPEFSDMVYNLIDQYLPWDRVVIQSFDFRVLKYWHEKYPTVRLAALIDNLHTIDENIKALGFTPSVYSPDYTLLDKAEVKRCHQLKMRVIPWTVNDPTEMVALKGMNVDGFITDYPNRAAKFKMTLNINRK